jgi:branched-chain amino acid transport system substrate-binding protein
MLNQDTNAPTILGPRTFTPTLHIQTSMPMTVVSYADGKETPVMSWTIQQKIPLPVLYRLKK